METVILFLDGLLLAHVSVMSIMLMLWAFDNYDVIESRIQNPFLNLSLLLLFALTNIVFIFMAPSTIYLFFGLASSMDITQFEGKTLTYVRNQGLQELPNPKASFLLGFLISFPLAGRWLWKLKVKTTVSIDALKNLPEIAAAIPDKAFKELLLYDIRKLKDIGPVTMTVDLSNGEYTLSASKRRMLKAPENIHHGFKALMPFRMSLARTKGSFLTLDIQYTTDKQARSQHIRILASGRVCYGWLSRRIHRTLETSIPLSSYLGYTELDKLIKQSR